MRSFSIRGVVPVMALAAVAACGDAVAPVGTSGTGPVLASVDRFGPVNADVIVDFMSPDSLSADITVTPTGGWFRIGNHGIHFPASAICDPAISSYGPGTWDEPCTVLDAPIRIHAEVRTQDGRSWVDFTPALRFAPSANDSGSVWVYLRSDGAHDADQLSQLGILWSHAIGEPGIDESLEDSTLRTYVDTERGVAFRRIKHFSGYSVSSGIRSTASELTGALGF